MIPTLRQHSLEVLHKLTYIIFHYYTYYIIIYYIYFYTNVVFLFQQKVPTVRGFVYFMMVFVLSYFSYALTSRNKYQYQYLRNRVRKDEGD